MKGNIPIPELPLAEEVWLMVAVTSVRERRTQQGKPFREANARNATGNLAQATRTLSGLQRRVSRALADGAASRRRSGAAAIGAAPRPRRKVTDPEVLERRRQALVKARAARQAKREAAKR